MPYCFGGGGRWQEVRTRWMRPVAPNPNPGGIEQRHGQVQVASTGHSKQAADEIPGSVGAWPPSSTPPASPNAPRTPESPPSPVPPTTPPLLRLPRYWREDHRNFYEQGAQRASPTLSDWGREVAIALQNIIGSSSSLGSPLS